MKTILAFGDSLTWGFVPGKGERHAVEARWPNVLAKTLDPDQKGKLTIITEGLNGRTTAYDDHLADCDRNGARIFPTLLASHAPLDLIIIMLGCNDLKPHIAGNALAARHGMRRLVSIVKRHNPGIASIDASQILIVSPPHLTQTADEEFSAMFAGGVEQSKMLGLFYRDLADAEEIGFFDAASAAKASPIDGVHLDAKNSAAIGKALAPIVTLMLGF